MDTIKLWGGIGGVFHGVHCGNVGVYTRKNGGNYAGEHGDGQAHGFGVHKDSAGRTVSGQFVGGRRRGHHEVHWATGDVYYVLWNWYASRYPVHWARVKPNGDCAYDDQPCGADHAGLVALKEAAQRAGVRTCPLPASPHPRPQARAIGRTVHVRVRVRVRVCVPVCVRGP